MSAPRGAVAAGHPLTAEAGADVLRAGGNAADAAVAAMLASMAAEPLFTGLGAGGYLLHAAPGEPPVLLDFFVEAPGRDPASGTAELLPVDVSFGDAVQVFHIGPASVGTPGVVAGIAEASRRFGTLPLADLAAPAARLAARGVQIVPEQAYVIEILSGIVTSTPEAAAIFAPGGSLLKAGDVVRQPELADALTRLGAEGAEPFYTGDVAAAIAEWLSARGGQLSAADLAAYEVVDRRPVRTCYRGHEVVTNPPPSAGGILIAAVLSELDRLPAPVAPAALVEAMAAAQRRRTPEFLTGLDAPGFTERFLGPAGRPGSPGRLGSTTHISVIDGDGGACAVTCSAGACSGVIVPGTGVHLNNMLGEQDLNPLGFHTFPAGRRLPSMMAPTIVERDGAPRLVLGSAGSNRIRSAILQTILRLVDEGLHAPQAIEAPRLHFEADVIYAEPGIDLTPIEHAGWAVARFRARNLFFGGVQAVERDEAGRLYGGGDPRRGGAAVVVA